MAIDVASSALDAIATYLAGLTGIAGASRGWPEHNVELDLTAGPVCTLVVAGGPRVSLCSPDYVDNSDPANVTWRVGFVELDAQLDLWAAYRAQRDAAAATIEAALHNRLPFKPGLELVTADYHGRPLTVTAAGGRPVDDTIAAEAGEWRCRWPLSILTDLVVVAASPKQALITARATVDGLTEPDKEIT